MVDVLLSTEDLTILGGPTSIDVNVGIGQTGTRGTYIFTGYGKPTDPGMQFVDNYDGVDIEVKAKDLFINLKDTDTEYLYLYQYEPKTGGGYQWVKTLRLVPNTALANAEVLFWNGAAYTFTSLQGLTSAESMALLKTLDLSTIIPSPTAPVPALSGMLWLDLSGTLPILKQYTTTWTSLGTVVPGIFVPLASYFPVAQLPYITAAEFNIQYDLLNDQATSSSITVDDVFTNDLGTFLPISVNAVEATISPTLGVSWAPLTGVKMVHLLMTAGIGS